MINWGILYEFTAVHCVGSSVDTEIIEGKLLNGRQTIDSVKAWTGALRV